MNCHLRQGPESIDNRFENGRAGWRGQLGLDRHVGQRDALEQLGGPRRRHRANAVGDADRAPSGRNPAGDDLIGPQHVKADRGADDIDNRVDRADFVKMDPVDRRSVHAGLGLRDGAENPPCQVFLGLCDPLRPVDDFMNVRQVAMGVLRRMLDAHVGRSKSAFDDRLSAELDPWQAERIDGFSNDGGIDAGVDQRGQRHVSADSSRAVEIGDAHDGAFPFERGRILPRFRRRVQDHSPQANRGERGER